MINLFTLHLSFIVEQPYQWEMIDKITALQTVNACFQEFAKWHISESRLKGIDIVKSWPGPGQNYNRL